MQIDQKKTSTQTQIFSDSKLSKRLAVRIINVVGKITKSTTAHLKPSTTPNARLLIQSMGGIGNTVMATPLIAQARHAFPNARIDLLTSPGAARLLNSTTGISNVYIDDGRLEKLFALTREFRAVRYDAAIVALNSHLSKFATRIVFSNIPRRLMHQYLFRFYDDFSAAYTHVLPRPNERHDVECNLDLLSALTGDEYEPGPLEVGLTNLDRKQSADALVGLGWKPRNRSVAFCVGSSGWMAFKRWPLDLATKCVDNLLATYPDLNIVIVCGPDEKSDVSMWNSRYQNRSVIVVENVGLNLACGILSLMNVVVANDNLGMHLAASQGVSVVALFGPTNPLRTGPWKCRSVTLTPAICEPYYDLPYPPNPSVYPDYMADIAPELVAESVKSMLI